MLDLISECTAYDFKSMLEERRPKSWLKSVSAFANGSGGSLFFGIEDDGTIRGLDNIQYVSEVISSQIRDRMDPLPSVELVPRDVNGMKVLELMVKAGGYTPYYYMGDNQRIAFVRVGDESVPATDEQMMRLVLKGTNRSFDSIHTTYSLQDFTFIMLANTYRQRLDLPWDKKICQVVWAGDRRGVSDECRSFVCRRVSFVSVETVLHAMEWS